MSPTVETKSFQKKWYGNSTTCVWTWQNIEFLAENTSLFLGPESGKIWWLKKVQYIQKKYHCQWTLLRGKKPKWIFHNLGNLLRPLELEYQPRVSEWFPQNGKYAQFLEAAYQEQK